MAEPFALDEMPAPDNESSLGGLDDGKVQCPECPNRYKPSGLQRHITMAHRDGISESGTSSVKRNQPKSSQVIETRWAEFQRGAALLVSLACSQCATALSEDAEKDAIALAHFCEHKPKLRKQVEQFLSTADFMLLLGAFGGTAQKMVSHHSIGKKLPGIVPVDNNGHLNHEPMDRIKTFLGDLPPEARHEMFDRVFAKEQPQQPQQQEPVGAHAVVDDANPMFVDDGADMPMGAGSEPVPEATGLTEHDKAIRDAMNSGTEFMETVGSLG